MNKAQLREDYQEAVRLYVWYSESPFSFFQGKADKVQANKYRMLTHSILEKIAQAEKSNP